MIGRRSKANYFCPLGRGGTELGGRNEGGGGSRAGVEAAVVGLALANGSANSIPMIMQKKMSQRSR